MSTDTSTTPQVHLTRRGRSLLLLALGLAGVGLRNRRTVVSTAR